MNAMCKPLPDTFASHTESVHVGAVTRPTAPWPSRYINVGVYNSAPRLGAWDTNTTVDPFPDNDGVPLGCSPRTPIHPSISSTPEAMHAWVATTSIDTSSGGPNALVRLDRVQRKIWAS